MTEHGHTHRAWTSGPMFATSGTQAASWDWSLVATSTV
jgi:hypothetical protein